MTWGFQVKNSASWSNPRKMSDVNFFLKIDNTNFLLIEGIYKLIIGVGQHPWREVTKETTVWSSPNKN